MTLEMLLEEDKAIKSKISAAMDNVRQWFEQKMYQAKSLFESMRDKISDKLDTLRGKVFKGKQLPKDITIETEEGTTVLAKEGEDADSVIVRLKNSLTAILRKLKEKCHNAVIKCQTAIRKFLGIKDDRTVVVIQQEQKDVLDTIEQAENVALKAIKMTGAILTTATIVLVGVSFAKDKDKTIDKVFDRANDTIDHGLKGVNSLFSGSVGK